MAAFTFPIPEWARTTLLSFKLPVVNRIPWTVTSALSVSCWPSVSISKVIALSTAMTRVVGAGRGVLPTWATLAAESSRKRKEKTQSDLRIGLIVAPYFLAPLCVSSPERSPASMIPLPKCPVLWHNSRHEHFYPLSPSQGNRRRANESAGLILRARAIRQRVRANAIRRSSLQRSFDQRLGQIPQRTVHRWRGGRHNRFPRNAHDRGARAHTR